MVTFITILQVNLVMSILLYVMVLVYLYGIQANNMDSSQQQSSADPLNSLIIQLLQADLTRGRTRGNQSQQSKSRDPEPQDVLPPILGASLPLEEERGGEEQWGVGGHSDGVDQHLVLLNSELLRQQKRYNSPRVLLSDRPPLQPPPLYLADDFVSGDPSSGAAANKTRKKRYAEHRSYRGEYSVCDSESQWVTDKTQAVDTRGNTVTVLAKFKTSPTQDIKQFFYETRCRTPRPFKGGCRGIDDKNWNSQCKTTQTHVRALTKLGNSLGWRWIRIDTSCVCALSRKHRRT
ncbi:neurotrophin-3 isoform X1 [Takifugu rubripes]|uniref:Neurotrophin-3 n=2 Tax=Takifugu rubripes TaxID=31033 RepID=A0A3B5K9Q0_TAKRU|nr:neurotrophin-3 isoform X1 [Takifugu rubripes]|eukprot:XP_011611830.1 PREDICTED: neurotrophin-3 [Takifugu rubripes]